MKNKTPIGAKSLAVASGHARVSSTTEYVFMASIDGQP